MQYVEEIYRITYKPYDNVYGILYDFPQVSTHGKMFMYLMRCLEYLPPIFTKLLDHVFVQIL